MMRALDVARARSSPFSSKSSATRKATDRPRPTTRPLPMTRPGITGLRKLTLRSIDAGTSVRMYLPAEGRLVVLAHLVALVIAGVQLEPLDHPVDFGFAVLVLGASLLAFCWRKGEPLRWMSSKSG